MNVINQAELIDQLERILHSRAMQGSDALRAFLQFVVRKTIEGEESQIKEYVIATEVFGRGRDFDSRVDSVVRVQAGRLRTKLLEFYATEGRDSRVIIELPKGHYTPVFSYVQSGNAESPLRAEAISEAATADEELKERLIAAPLWSELLRFPEPLLVVFSNTIFHGSYHDGMKLFNSLNVIGAGDDSSTLAQSVETNGAEHLPRIDHYTGIGELMGVYCLGEFFARMSHPFRVKRSLMLTWDDARTANIIVLGSPAENLFLLDLPQQQDFIFRWVRDEREHYVNAIINTSPQPGEQECYLARQFGASPSQISEDYAVVSLLHGLSGKNRLLILAGINTFGTQAAAEYVTRLEYVSDLISHLNLAAPDEPPRLPSAFQIVLKVKVNGGVPIQVSYVTHHILSR
jgi:hypothetical protein